LEVVNQSYLRQVWSLPNRKFACSLVDHSNWVRSACFSPNSSLAATGSDDKTVKLWDVSSHQLLHTFHDHTKFENRLPKKIIEIIFLYSAL